MSLVSPITAWLHLSPAGQERNPVDKIAEGTATSYDLDVRIQEISTVGPSTKVAFVTFISIQSHGPWSRGRAMHPLVTRLQDGAHEWPVAYRSCFPSFGEWACSVLLNPSRLECYPA
jgi:hypothetical protein